MTRRQPRSTLSYTLLPSTTLFLCAIGAGMWLLHPLFVSTTLYIVQREAMLPATFTLLGLLAWLHGRARIASGDVWRGLVWIAAGLGGCTVLGVLRSEEHTSELQSLMRISYAVFCLTKKKPNN